MPQKLMIISILGMQFAGPEYKLWGINLLLFIM